MKWISLNASLPPPNKKVLWYDKMFDEIHLFGMEKPEQYDGDYTHWMKLPDGPLNKVVEYDTNAETHRNAEKSITK